MCLHPYIMQNPNKGEGIRRIAYYKSSGDNTIKKWIHQSRWNEEQVNFYKDHETTNIYLKCGHCAECIQEKIQNYAQRILMESLNNHIFMAMLSYSNEMIPRITLENGKTITFADTYDVSQMFERMDKWRNRGQHEHRYIKYPHKIFAVSELGGKKGRPHFHLLILIPKRFGKDINEIRNIENELYWTIRLNWCRNEGTNRKPIYTPLFKYAERWHNGKIEKNYDLHYVQPEITKNGVSDAAFYVLKYLLKQQNNENNDNKIKQSTAKELEQEIGWEYHRKLKLKKMCNKEEFELVWPRIKSKCFYSKHFGLNKQRHIEGGTMNDRQIEEYIKYCINWSKGKYPFPAFINPATKTTAPLCEYYRKKFMTFQDVKDFWNPEQIGFTKYGERSHTEVKVKKDKQKHIQDHLNKLSNFDYDYTD